MHIIIGTDKWPTCSCTSYHKLCAWFFDCFSLWFLRLWFPGTIKPCFTGTNVYYPACTSYLRKKLSPPEPSNIAGSMKLTWKSSIGSDIKYMSVNTSHLTLEPFINNLSHYHIQSVNHFLNSMSNPIKGNTPNNTCINIYPSWNIKIAYANHGYHFKRQYQFRLDAHLTTVLIISDHYISNKTS